jgi:hypothetical protein
VLRRKTTNAEQLAALERALKTLRGWTL